MRRIVLAVLTVLCVVVAALPAWAGGWAVTTIVEAPRQFVPGETHNVVFEIRQHGVALLSDLDDVAIVLTSLDGGDTREFAAHSRGTRWIAAVRTPAAGTWTWAVRPGWFATYELGTFPLAATSAAWATDTARLAAGAVIVALGGLLVLVRRRVAVPASA